MILLLSGWGPIDGVVGFMLLVRKEESLVEFPFGGEVRWVGLEEGMSEWVRALVVCVWVWVGGGYIFQWYSGGSIFPVLILIFYYFFNFNPS